MLVGEHGAALCSADFEIIGGGLLHGHVDPRLCVIADDLSRVVMRAYDASTLWVYDAGNDTTRQVRAPGVVRELVMVGLRGAALTVGGRAGGEVAYLLDLEHGTFQKGGELAFQGVLGANAHYLVHADQKGSVTVFGLDVPSA
jgi:hypothetical protein